MKLHGLWALSFSVLSQYILMETIAIYQVKKFSMKRKAYLYCPSEEWLMLWYEWYVWCLKYFKRDQYISSAVFQNLFFHFLHLLCWFSTLGGSALALAQNRWIDLICPRGKKSFCFMFLYAYIAKRITDRRLDYDQLHMDMQRKIRIIYPLPLYKRKSIQADWTRLTLAVGEMNQVSLCALPRELNL